MLQYLRSALRGLRKAPAFSAATVTILALAIGANTAMFSILEAWFLKPLHFKDSDQVVIALRRDIKRPDAIPVFAFYRDYLDWKRATRSFQGLSAMFWQEFTVTGGGEADHFTGMIVTGDMFDTLGVKAELGRTFLPVDMEGPAPVVISHQLWQERFGGRPDVVGRTLTLNAKTYQVIGILPSSFSLRMENQPFDPKVLALIQTGDPDYTSASLRPVAVIARLKPNVDLAAAQAELFTIQTALDARHPEVPQGTGVFLTRLQDDNTRFIRSSLFTLSAAVLLVLMVACINVAGLLLGRAIDRAREMALRGALGASRRRLIEQLLTESLVLSVAGAASGIALAYAGVRAFAAADPFNQLPPDPIALSARALVFAVSLAGINTLLFGLVPAWQASRVDLAGLLRSRTASHGAASMRNLLVVVEIALSMILLTGVGVLTKTLTRLSSEPLGFHTGHVWVTTLSLPLAPYASSQSRLLALYDRLLQRAASLPGVSEAAIGSAAPLQMGQMTYAAIAGRPEPPRDELPRFEQQFVTPGYFSVLSVPLLRGRTFSASDTSTSQPVAIVNEAFTRAEFPGEDPVGRQIRVGREGASRTIVGVAGTMRTVFFNTLTAKEPLEVFVPAAQAPALAFNRGTRNVWLFARGSRPISLAEFRRQVDAIDSNVAVPEIKRADEFLADATRQPRIRATLLAGFAVLVLVLAAIGIYGLVAQNATSRTGEIGVRIALGARTPDLIVMIVRQGFALAAVGSALGIVGAAALARAMSGFLYGASGLDPAVYAGVSAVMIVLAILAAWLPARRASRVDPTVALRCE
jgi:putative ABC transport system permease protein